MVFEFDHRSKKKEKERVSPGSISGWCKVSVASVVLLVIAPAALGEEWDICMVRVMCVCGVTRLQGPAFQLALPYAYAPSDLGLDMSLTLMQRRRSRESCRAAAGTFLAAGVS